MFSSRLDWSVSRNRITEAIERKRRAGAPVLDLTESNPTLAGFDYPREVVEAFSDDRMLVYSPAAAGLDRARAAVASYYAERGRTVDPARILLTASTSEAYSYLFKLLCNPGDHVLVPRPSYPLFEFLARLESVDILPYPLRYHGVWSVDFEALEDTVTPRTKALVVVNPNNPTGSYLKSAEAARMERLCADRGLALISDEVFSDYELAPDAERVLTLVGIENCLAFSMSGLSKSAGLPQMKFGWIVVSGPDRERRSAFEKLEWIADTYLSVSTPVQCAAPQLLKAGESVASQIRHRTARNLAFARDLLAGSACNILAVEGGWYITIQVPRVRTEEEWTLKLIDEANVLVQPGFFFDFESEAFLVVSLLTAADTFLEGVTRIARFAR